MGALEGIVGLGPGERVRRGAGQPLGDEPEEGLGQEQGPGGQCQAPVWVAAQTAADRPSRANPRSARAATKPAWK
jgi:hypothetical protein